MELNRSTSERGWYRAVFRRVAWIAAGCATTAGLVLGGCSGAGDEELTLATSREAVQLAWVGPNESTTTTGVNLLRASSQSTKGRATGAMRYGIASGVKYNCGVTFISHRYAMTAAHCVDGLTLSQTFTVEQFNTVNLNLSQAYGEQGQVSGNWPDYYRARKLTSADGYNVTTHGSCRVVRRCSNIYGRDNCPLASDKSLDLAMIYCPNRPTNVVNYVPVATNANATAVKNGTKNLEVWWFHEVVNLATSDADPYEPYMPEFNWYHYGLYPQDGDLTQNYHYWHSGADTDRQLLPLVSKHTATNQPYRALTVESQYIVGTNIPVCHGTSGSGVFVAGTNEFLGVVAEFGNSFNGIPLCVPMPDSSAGNGMGYTQHNWAQTFFAQAEVQADL